MSDRDEWTLVLRDVGHDERPVEVRLRLALKHLLRSCAFRVVEIRPDIACQTIGDARKGHGTAASSDRELDAAA